jgi:hypothetical protein
MTGDDGRRAGSAKGNMSIDGQSIKLSVDKTKATSGNESSSYVEYELDSSYSTFIADFSGVQNTSFRVFADDNLVYDSEKGLSRGGLSVNVNVNISGAKKLRIEAYGITGTPSGYIQIDNARVIG